MRIGLLFPSENERNPLTDHLHIKEEIKYCGLEFLKADFLKHELIIVVSGICKVNASIASQLLIDKFEVETIINTGVCGGLDKRIKLFDTVISEKIYYHDVDQVFITEEIPFLEAGYFESDKNLLNISKHIAKEDSTVKIGTTICGEQFITDNERPELIERYRAYSVDMETGAVAHVCHVNNIPFIAVRSITDDYDHNGIEFFRENVVKASKIAVDKTKKIIEMM